MTDLRELLHSTAAEGSDAVDVDPDAVADRIRHRRTRNRRLAIAGVSLTIAMVIGGVGWVVAPGDEQAPAAGEPPRLVKSDADGPAGMQAALHTTLTADENGCVRGGSGRSTVTLVWPRTYTVRGDTSSFEILDGAGKVVARSGVPLTIGGGGTGGGFHNTWTGRDCATPGPFWLVGEIS